MEWKVDCGQTKMDTEPSEKAIAVEQVREDGGLEKDGGNEGGEISSLKLYVRGEGVKLYVRGEFKSLWCFTECGVSLRVKSEV